MIKHVWSVLAESAVIDKASNNVSIFNAIQEIRTPPPPVIDSGEEPLMGLSYCIASLWRRADPAVPAHAHGRVRVQTPAGETFQLGTFEIRLQRKEYARTLSKMFGIAVQEGLFFFLVEVSNDDQEEWNEAARLPLRMTLVEGNEPEEG